MRRVFFILLTMVFVLGFFFLDPLKNAKKRDAEKLYKISAFEENYLKVSDTHQIFYELSGSPKGIPVFVLQTDPGLPVFKKLKKFFNPHNFLVVTFDQRGSGMSRPLGEIEENTTQNIISDMEKLRVHLKLDKIILFGGFWGAGAALLYAENYPENVKGMVLWSCFTGTSDEIKHIYYGSAEQFFPEAHKKLLQGLDNSSKGSLPEILTNGLLKMNFKSRDQYTKKWIEYWLTITGSTPQFNPLSGLNKARKYAFALIENFYMANRYFLKGDPVLDNIAKIEDKPVFIINGRYDVMAPSDRAAVINRHLKNSKLVIVDNKGHWPDSDIMKKEIARGIKFVLSSAGK